MLVASTIRRLVYVTKSGLRKNLGRITACKRPRHPFPLPGPSSVKPAMSVRSSTAMAKRIASCCRSLRTDSRVATKLYTSSIRIKIVTICNGWLRQGSTRRPLSRAGNWSFGPALKPTFGTAVSIRIGYVQALRERQLVREDRLSPVPHTGKGKRLHLHGLPPKVNGYESNTRQWVRVLVR